ncbi:MAG: T9SS type A sorting domain-containing protein [Bacteroidota bacterium]|nr:T9SS type A sorting domain-containing protein [Bacteroidota bacterium]
MKTKKKHQSLEYQNIPYRNICGIYTPIMKMGQYLSIALLTIVMPAITLNAQTFQWVKGLSGSNNVGIIATVADVSGNVYAIGTFSGIADFDPGATVLNLNSTAGRGFLTKFSPSGNLLWARQFGGSDYPISFVASVALDLSGNPVLCGYFSGLQDFNPLNPGVNVVYSSSEHAGFILKYSSSGTFQWVKTIGESGFGCNLSFAEMVVDPSNNILFTGSFSTGPTIGLDFDPGSSTNLLMGTWNGVSWNTTFILKLDAAGNFVWAKKLAVNPSVMSAAPTYGYSIATDASGNVYTAGSFQYSTIVDFDPGTGVHELTAGHYAYDGFILKLNAAGEYVNVIQIAGTEAFANYFKIRTDGAGNIFTSGQYAGTLDFDPGIGTNTLTSHAYNPYDLDSYIAKYSSIGVLQWAKSISGVTTNKINNLCVDNCGNVYSIGDFYGTIDFDPGTSTYNLSTSIQYVHDKFLLKLNNAGDFQYVKSWSAPSQYNQSFSALSLDGSNNIFMGGQFAGTLDFDPGIGATNLSSGTGLSDAFILKLSASSVVPVCTLISSANTAGVLIGNANTGAAVNQMFIGYGYQSMIINCTPTGCAPFTYSWSGTGLSGTGASRVFTPLMHGQYNIVCTVTNSCGCQTTCNIVICVRDIRTPGSVGRVNICHNGTTSDYPVAAINGHIGHGDVLGICNGLPCGLGKKAQTKENINQIDEDNKKETELSVYPNPSNNSFNFNLESISDEPVFIKIYDISGRLVSSISNNKSKQIIVVRDELTNGTYLAEVVQGDFKKTVKLFKIE